MSSPLPSRPRLAEDDEFDALDEIAECGYAAAIGPLAAWRAAAEPTVQAVR